MSACHRPAVRVRTLAGSRVDAAKLQLWIVHGMVVVTAWARTGTGDGLRQSAATDWTRIYLRTGRERGLFADTNKLRS